MGYLRVKSSYSFYVKGTDTVVCYCLVTKLCLILCDPMGWGTPVSSVHGISQARILEWVAVSSSRGSSQLRD